MTGVGLEGVRHDRGLPRDDSAVLFGLEGASDPVRCC
ncbi:hypothetical protein STVIR_0798 [Streptomyces viridochromogenes Tue57]|uniref:Uncharacterized protein n=1 Tax=Streptomyces viridochromogenes Tue57 TaxID=1160705 RepID=L8PS83_STRVR|nr:hypothetical protein STVIR_0798 [Streptomyces viridochromogenes Tue57]